MIMQKFIIFAVGTNWINKCWSVENFAKLSDLLAEYKLKVVLIGFGKDDEQKSQAIIKLARENNISVSKDEIEEIFNEHRKTSNAEVSESAFNKIIEDNYKLSPSEYRRMFIELPLLKQKVSAKILRATCSGQLISCVQILATKPYSLLFASSSSLSKISIESTGLITSFERYLHLDRSLVKVLDDRMHL